MLIVISRKWRKVALLRRLLSRNRLNIVDQKTVSKLYVMKNIMETDKEISTEQKIGEKMIVEKQTKEHRHKVFTSSVVASVLVSVFIGAVAGFTASEISNKSLRKIVEQITVSREQVEGSEFSIPGKVIRKDGTISVIEEESAVIDAVEQASPAVVSVIVTKDVPKLDDHYLDPFSGDPFFNPFGFYSVPRGDMEMERKEIGGGTGFIVDEEGFIITNRHVVDDKDAEYTVIMNDGTKFDATVLARDSFVDLAIIKIESDKKFPKIEFGNSDVLKRGQTVIAIGNSLGEFQNTVSKGIVSGLKRSVSAGDGMGQTELLDELIQTDAAINPGNSGGPIVNLQGQVIGVNVAMAQGAENIGFAIPISEAKKIYRSVKETGRIVRPYIGVRYVLLNEQIQKDNKLPYAHGALIIRGQRRTDLAVIPGSPADKAGLVENDIILEIEGVKIAQENDLSRIIKGKEVGDRLMLKVWSKGDEKMSEVVLEEAK